MVDGGGVDPAVARQSRDIDPVVVGRRIRDARLVAGLTQEELGAVGDMSGAYISRIESGTRRAGVELLRQMAQALGTTVEDLVASESPEPRLETELRIDYAELALKSSDPATALADVRELLAARDATLTPSMTLRAREIEASALEALGHYQDAIHQLESLLVDAPRDTAWIGIAMALSRCYRISGDLDRAAKIGTDAEDEVERLGLAGTEEAIRLTVNTAGALLERGELARALQMCLDAAERAEQIGSSFARASAYWNASVVESRQGNPASAVVLAKRALQAFEARGDVRAIARLQAQLARMQLMTQPPDLQSAEDNVARATDLMTWSDATLAERTDLRLVAAKVALLRGKLTEARSIADECLSDAEAVGPVNVADASMLLGRVALAEKDLAQALDRFQRAAEVLAGCEADRQVAECWFELGSLFQESGDQAGAMDAYRRAAASTGLSVQQETPVTV
jgi:transcriptional regulator with XRE-family HTH domain/Tfp pilus assembly protein PilF